MLKFLQKVAKYRRIVLIFLFVPIVAVFLNLSNGLRFFPEDSFIRFKIEFYVPSKLSSEIEKKVTTVAEKTFNGLSNLISIESLIFKSPPEVAPIIYPFESFVID